MDSLPPSEAEGRPLTFLAAAGWALLFFLLFTLSVQIAEAARPGAFTDVVTQTACGAFSTSLVLFAILRVHEPDSSIRQVLALRPPSILGLLLAIIIGVALALPASYLSSLLELRYPLEEKDAEALALIYAAPTASKKIILVATVVVIGPVFDELFFHGALFTPLLRGRRVGLVVMATAAFEALMNDPRKTLVLFVALLAFGWIRALTGTIVSSTAARMAFYGVSLVPGVVLGRELPKMSNAILVGSAALAAAALAALAALSRRDPRAVDARVDD